MSDSISIAVRALQELQEDTQIPKSLRVRISPVIISLQEEGETKTRVSKALAILEDLSNDSSLESFARMELYKITGILESQ